MYDTSLNETIYSSGFLIGVDEPNTPPLRNITLLALLSETKDLLKKKELDERDLNILNSLKDFISLKTRKQQDLGF